MSSVDTPYFQEATLLVLLNKQDLNTSRCINGLVDELDFKDLCLERQYHVVATVATRGEGLKEGIQWLCDHMDEL